MKKKRWVVILVGIMAFLCVGLPLISFIINQMQPVDALTVDVLTEADLLRLEEARTLQRTFGSQVFPGWGEAEIPLILFNDQYAFLSGLEAPAAGWIKVPQDRVQGAAWQPIEGGYYRQQVENPAEVIGAFTVVIGENWAAAFGTEGYARQSFQQGFREELPPVVREIFPYPLAYQAMMGSTDRYLMAILHEMFHAYQGMLQPGHLIAAEQMMQLDSAYPYEAAAEMWKAELGVLLKAVKAEDPAQKAALARQFLQMRQQRRAGSLFSTEMMRFEQQREWLEGLAKYAELTIGNLAAETEDYQPVTGLAAVDQNFKGYRGYAQFYRLQVDQIDKIVGNHSEVIFYYSGAGQAMLLDMLNPAWKPLAMQEGATLEGILADTLSNLP